jgi:Tfp pilus assembly protein PilF
VVLAHHPLAVARTVRRRGVSGRHARTVTRNAASSRMARRVGRRAGFALLLILMLGAGNACSTSGGRGTVTTAAPAAPPAPATAADVRLRTPLDEIAPLVSRPDNTAASRPLSDRARGQLATAEDLVRRQRYSEALQQAEGALRYDPGHPVILRTLAEVHYASGDLHNARALLEQALTAQGDAARAQVLRGFIERRLGNDTAARDALRTALLCGDFGSDAQLAVRVHHALAELLAEQGYVQAALDAREAIRSIGDAVPEDAGDPIFGPRPAIDPFFHVDLLERLGRFSEASAELAALLAKDPHDERARLAYARVLYREGRLEEALEAARGASEPTSELLQLLLDLHTRMGDSGQIAVELRKAWTRPPAEEDLMVIAKGLVAQGRLDAARQVLDEYVRQRPEAQETRGALVTTLAGQREWRRAVLAAAAGIVQDPASAGTWAEQVAAFAQNPDAVTALLDTDAVLEGYADAYLKGMLARAARRRRQAESLLAQSDALNPRFVGAREALGRLYLEDYRYDDALKVAARADGAIAEEPGLETILGLANAALERADVAELHFRAALQLDRTNTEAGYALARIYLSTGRTNNGMRQLRAVVEVDPAHEPARERLASAYFREGRGNEGIRQYQELRQATDRPPVRARCDAVLAQFQHPDPEAYRRALLDAVERGEADWRTWMLIADTYGPFEQDAARDAYHRALELDPRDEGARIGLIQAEWALLNFDRVVELWNEVIPSRPNHHGWWLGPRGLILAHRALQDNEAALAASRRGAQRTDLSEETRREYRLSIIGILWTTGRRADAYEQIQSWQEEEPDGGRWPLVLANLYTEDERAVDAIPILREHLEREPGDAAARDMLRDAYLAADQPTAALQGILSRLADDPENDEDLLELAYVLNRAERHDDSLELLEAWSAVTTNRPRFQEAMIQTLHDAKRYEACVEHIENWLDEASRAPRPADPLVDALRRALVLELVESGEGEEAERRLAAWIDLAQDRATRYGFLLLLAYAQEARGLVEASTTTKERALAIDPQDVTLNNDVAYGWIEQGIRLDEAERLIRFAVAAEPLQSAYLDTLGWLRYKQGRFEEARTWLQRALGANRSDDAVIRDHFGDTCWRLGEREEAVRHWQEAHARIKEREEPPRSADERRAAEQLPGKIAAAGAGAEPAVAVLAQPADPSPAPKTDPEGPRDPTEN